MSRDLPEELAQAIEEPVVRPFLAVKIDLDDPVHAWTGAGTIAFADSGGTPREWIGAGGIGAIDSVDEATDGSATGMVVTLFGHFQDGAFVDGVPAIYSQDIAAQATRGAKFEVYVGALETGSDWHSVKATKLLWRGRLDKYEITDAGESLSVRITGESRAIDQRRPAIKRFTNEYQQRRHPGDRFFEYVPQMMEIPILWAKAEASAVTSGGGGGGLFGIAQRNVSA